MQRTSQSRALRGWHAPRVGHWWAFGVGLDVVYLGDLVGWRAALTRGNALWGGTQGRDARELARENTEEQLMTTCP